MKKVGLFGGTFDPIHIGHLHLAIELFEAADLDEVLFCPAYCSPFKTATPPIASPEDRYEMVKRALAPFPHFTPLHWEIERQGPSYTIETIRFLKKERKESLFLLLSDEAALHFSAWKEADQLLQLAAPLVGGQNPHLPHPLLEKGFYKIPRFEISSTWIRERFAKGKTCAHLLSPSVLAWIVEKKIYV